MTKIKSIEIKNFKAISDLAIDFNGCTAIIIGGNNRGKSSFLRGIPDRIRGEKPEMIVKSGEKDGKGVMTLTNGERFEWDFDNKGKDKLIFVTAEGYPSTITRDIAKRYFPPLFDIDKFLNSSPADQTKQLQKVVGVDFSKIEARYKAAYDDRTDKNKLAERFHAKLVQMLEAPKVDAVNVETLQAQKEQIRAGLNNEYKITKAANDKLRDEYNLLCDSLRKEVEVHNAKQISLRNNYSNARKAWEDLEGCGYKGFEVAEFCKELESKLLEKREFVAPKEPVYDTELPNDSKLREIDEQILQASITNQKAAEYKNYIEYREQVEQAQETATQADIIVKGIEDEREQMILGVKMPTGIKFGDGNILVDGFPLDKNQISTSKLYCAALRIASLNLGEVKCLHFDASTLDKNTLAEIEAWANSNDCQLLIERPDFEGGEIKYELIETTNPE